ncbi:hypothetical protein EDC02_5434 [Micromonospora sp. Llam0]|uniref:hypothetical protein n=1 Tax=Micromonospora sp. Llam0 TaxID=2485143 RepID=UPI000F9163F0|nr:hypothetical protein [Micromonospora sp. Llam0]ROO63408.1 hypothetical protein EDC02_5434 [Micromonospora sp. Llam0]
MPTPVIDPTERHPDDIADATAYRSADPVWVWPPRAEQWRPGVVDTNSHLALLVRYQLPGGGTSVDSLLPRNVMARAEPADVDGTDSLPIRPRNLGPIPMRSAASA